MYTKLQTKILEFFFKKAGKSFNQRQIANRLKVSPTAVSKAIKGIKEINIQKDEETKRLAIQLDRNKAIHLKRANNLKQLYESGLVNHLDSHFPGSAIVLFGSYSYGEDIFNSDIDIAIIGSEETEINLNKYEKILEREINVQFFEKIQNISENLRQSIINGIILEGTI